MTKHPLPVLVRPTQPRDFDGITTLCTRVYQSTPWQPSQLRSHLRVFPEGQFVAEDAETGRIVGMAASLIVLWDDYDIDVNWKTITDNGYFTNHDPNGHTLYGAEVMTDPDIRGRGVGKALYAARRTLTRLLRLLRIRAGSRLRGYHRYADRMSVEEYVERVVAGEIGDPTLTFQLRQRFRVIAVARGYLQHDPESHGHAAVIEWINHEVAKHRHYANRNTRFLGKRFQDPSTR